MIWIFVLLISLAAALVKLGMYSVWVSILAATCKVAGLGFALMAIVYFWRKIIYRDVAKRNFP